VRLYIRVTVSIGVGLLLGAPACVHASTHCRPPHSRELKSNDQVRVYAKHAEYGGRDVFACFLRTGHRHYLGLSRPNPQYVDSYDEVSPIVLRGARVAWKYESAYRDGASYYIAVRDMQTEKLLRSSGRTGTQDTCNDDSCHSWEAHGPVVDGRGSIAWIATGSNLYGYRNKVYKSDVTRHAELIDSGARIAHDSLTRDGRTISWRHGDETRTAVFAR
jgi:hypothetical protein